MSEIDGKSVLWYEGWNALNQQLERYNLAIWTGARETFVVIYDRNKHLAAQADREGMYTVPTADCNSYAEAVTVALTEMIERVKREATYERG